MNLGDLQFRDGMASSGPTTCAMLPGGARPVYAEFLAEEPAVAPVTEDAVILIECGRDSVDQALVPVQLSFSQRHPGGYGFIAADPRTEGDAARMTFLSYTVQDEAIVTTVRKADGATERRRYLHEGGDRWGRG
ncbi:hypothetical protein MB27_42570 [Actinoplanes utahensis]|uniref:Uncharacterized protein n=2 Tax=Actinoplanes utahensis TaxID=1869 RepID=A0A0A6UAC0_ACTUT|nr:hypothetical protein MB27_42570 [Actinoplanes utahensis]